MICSAGTVKLHLALLKILDYKKARNYQLFCFELTCIFIFFFLNKEQRLPVACGFHLGYQPCADFSEMLQ